MAETSAPPTTVATVGVSLSDPTRYGVEVCVKVGDIEFRWLPDAAPLTAGASLRRLPVVDDPMLRAILRAALSGVIERLES